MPISTYSARSDGLYLQTGQGWLALIPYSPRTIRVRYNVDPAFSQKPSLIVTARPDPAAVYAVEETQDSLLFSTSEVSISIDRKTAAFTYRDRSGGLLTKEPDRGGMTLEPVDVIVSVFDESAAADSRENVDGMRADANIVRKVVDRQAYHTKLEFEWGDGEALYGLGSHEEGMLNLRGQHQDLYQQNMKAVVPVLVSTRGYGIFLDSCSLMTFHDDALGSYLWSEVDDELDYYFIYGPEFDQVIHELRRLTGLTPLLPRWVFGYIQSKERYTSQEELLDIVREYRMRKLPLDCIVLDWRSWTGNLWGQKTLDPLRFPDPDQMMEDLHALNARLMISVWPILRKGGDNWQEFHDKGLFLGNQATYDAFNVTARACYWRQANEGLFSHGIDAWWCDCTEPFEADWKGAIKPEPEERLRINTEESKRYLDPELINAYSLLHSQGIYEGQRATTSDKRVVNLTRSAYLGQQRYATITWSGDISANWETLHHQVAGGLNFCASGLPYWTVDIGAFFVQRKPDLWFWNGDYDAGVDDMGYRELYLRWFQYGAFLPIFRSHGTDTPREIWRFGQPGELIYDTLVKFLRLRYRLLPYIYSLAGWTTHADYTMLRALAFDFRSDPATYDIRDQYMFGPAFLVNPVTRPMVYAAGSARLEGISQTRHVYLPAGADWYDYWSDQKYAGGQILEADAPLDRIPLYVKAGSIIPVGPDIQFSGDLQNAPIELHVYPGDDGSFLLYEDEGDGYAYENGAYSKIDLLWFDQEQQLHLADRAGEYPGMPERREFHVILHDGQPNKVDSMENRVVYTGSKIVVQL